MCGVVAVFGTCQSEKLRNQVLEMSGKIRHRGPDWSGIYSSENAILAHERLSIVDPKSGKQPLYSKDKNLILAANGEIYNHQEIKSNLKSNYEFLTNSDCEVILALYNEKGSDFLEDLNGIFSFALYDEKKDFYLIARDHIGIIPLYMGWDKEGNFFVASELKALEGYCQEIKLFPPGHYFSSDDGQLTKWYQRDWENYENVKDNTTNISHLRESLSKAVKRQLMSDVPYGVLLSGGLDSSITTAIAKTFCQNRIETKDKKKAWWPSLHSFSELKRLLHVFFRYVDWILTVPLMCVEFYLILRAAGATKKLMWTLIGASTVMLVTGYWGEGVDRDNAWLWGLFSGLAYFYIVYLIMFGEAKALATSAGGEVLKAHNILCKFVLIGWAIYPIGYMAGTAGWYGGEGDLFGMTLAMDVVYNIGDAINKIGFGLVVYNLAVNSSK